MPVNGVDSDRNYSSIINGGGTSGKVYNAVFSDDDSSDLSVNDFFNMMITQLTNQDFMNPVDDTQYLAQMAQFATMQEMMDLCKYSKQNYVMSILGKEVTVSKNKIGGASEAITGIAEKILIENGEYKVYVDGKPYDFSKITQISAEPSGKEVDGSEEVGSEEKTDG